MPFLAKALFVRIALGLAVAATLCWARPAAAQVESREGIALQNQILELRSELQDLRGQIAAGAPADTGAPAAAYGQPQGDLLARLLTRVSALEAQVRSLTGRVDELANELQRQGAVLNKQIGDLAFRVQTLEGGGRSAPGRHAGTTRSAAPVAQQQPAEPDEAEAAPAAPEERSPPPGSLGALPLMPPSSGQSYGYEQTTPYMSGPPDYSSRYSQPRRSPSYAPENEGGALPLMPRESGEAGREARSRETRTAAAGGSLSLTPPAVMPDTTRAQSQPRTAEGMIREVRAALGRRDYPAAESGARELLKAGPERHAAEAHYLLARAQAGQRSYAQAAVGYDEAYKSAPNGPFAEASLFGMASSLASIGAKPAACAALDKLKSEFLTERASIREAETTLRRREGCE